MEAGREKAGERGGRSVFHSSGKEQKGTVGCVCGGGVPQLFALIYLQLSIFT